jgi:hypothetical protein
LCRNCPLKHVLEGKKWWEHDEEDVSNYWMTSGKRQDTEN